LTDARLLVIPQGHIGITRIGPEGVSDNAYPLREVRRVWAREGAPSFLERLYLPFSRFGFPVICVELAGSTMEFFVADPARWVSELQRALPLSGMGGPAGGSGRPSSG
ncbi:MAG: hypothetical protein L3K17_09315, partial [Thermoplasmata archaeon]|nr:hypothetical protein [Thermoplasmata archaeon]